MAPVRMRCSAVEYEAQPPTITGSSSSRMNFLRLSGSAVFETCSADTTVPWITRMSSSASSDDLRVPLDPLRRERRGGDDAGGLDLTDALADELFLDGSAYISCIRRVAFSVGESAISSNIASGSSYGSRGLRG